MGCFLVRTCFLQESSAVWSLWPLDPRFDPEACNMLSCKSTSFRRRISCP